MLSKPSVEMNIFGFVQLWRFTIGNENPTEYNFPLPNEQTGL